MPKESPGYGSSAVCPPLAYPNSVASSNFYFHSKEICSLALNSFQGNKGPHAKFDGIAVTRNSSTRSNGNYREHGAIEVSKGTINVSSKKWHSDIFEVVRGLLTILFHLKNLVGHDLGTVRKLQLPGPVHVGTLSHSHCLMCSGCVNVREPRLDCPVFPNELGQKSVSPGSGCIEFRSYNRSGIKEGFSFDA